MRSFGDLIEALGIATVAKTLDVTDSHVRVMKTRDSIPPGYWGPLIEIASKHKLRGVTWQLLKEFRTRRFRDNEQRVP